MFTVHRTESQILATNGRYCKACHNQTLRAVGGALAGRYTLEGHSRGAFSGGEIQRLRRLRQEAHTPTVLVAVSDCSPQRCPSPLNPMPPGGHPVPLPRSRPVCTILLYRNHLFHLLNTPCLHHIAGCILITIRQQHRRSRRISRSAYLINPKCH